MHTKLKSMKAAIIYLFAVIFVLIGFLSVNYAYAADNPVDAKSAVCQGIGAATGSDCDKTASSAKVDNTITTVIDILSIIVGVVAVIMIIIGGFKFVTSGGDSNAVTSARNTIIYAAVGLVIVAVAQTLVKFIVGKLQ